ncbi:MAG: heparinase II/III family protein, partial [Bacteroidetes bacterium]|nr:heparinase II/III family protein [Bacteroidota bacterium]
MGPWPGWRGIPDLPEIVLSWDEGRTPASVHFWGDELACGHMRAVAWLPPECSGTLRISVSDDRLLPDVVDLYEDSPIQPRPIPVTLRRDLVNVHPRLLVTPDIVAGLAGKVSTTHRAFWNRLCALVDQPQLPAEVTPESKAPSGPERLRPEDRAMITALRAMVFPTPATVDHALDASRTYVRKTQEPDYEPLSIDTQAGETLFVLVLGYDWLYHQMDGREKDEVRAWLWTAAARVRKFLNGERRDVAQAHYLGCALGLLACAFVFWEDHPEAKDWAAEFRGALDVILRMLPDDGFHPHGANLWIYEYGFLLRWLEVFRICAGEDLWGAVHWRHASAFRSATLSPDGLYGITFGDPQYRVGGDSWCHFLSASRTGTAAAQRTAELLVDGPHSGVDFRHVPARRRVYEFLYFDPLVLPGDSGPAIQVFQDGGQVYARGSEGAGTLFTMRAGPPIGHQRFMGGERGGYGHADPCNGSFLWFRRGTFAVSGPGPTYRRDTALHNTITINGQGQIGDGTVWLPDFFPPEYQCSTPRVILHGGSVSLDVDLAACYLPHLGVETCHRAMWVDPDTTIAGVDTVACRHVSDIQWNLHSWGEFVPLESGSELTWKIQSAGEELSVFLLAPDAGSTSTGQTDMIPAYPNDGTRDHFLRWQVHDTKVR